MKHLLTLLLAALLLTSMSSAHAQTPDPVRQKLDLIFANLDKRQVPTGRLAEYALPLAPLVNFDGRVLRDTGRTDLDGFRHLYATALTGRLAGTETLPSVPVFNQRVQAAAPTGPGAPIPIAVQYISYAHLRPDAETAGLLRLQNEQLFDVPGRSQSPYQTAVLFAAAPERSYAATSNVSLVLPSSLYLASGAPNTTLPGVELDFGDGQGYRPATWDQPLSTAYATAGTKRVKVRITYIYTLPRKKGELITSIAFDTRESWFDLTVFAVTAAARYSNAAGFDTVFAATGAPYPNATFTDHLGATVNVRFGKGHTRITKPFIVVEGYNTSRIAPHLVGQNNQNNTVKLFLESIDIRFGNNTVFDDALEQAGYDLIYIDFTEGTDDIRRNAALFEQVVRWANGWKRRVGSTERNVVMGQSMGGLVARYGLARLVRSGYDPQTRLLLLHDSPQRGAYSPMGMQALARQADFPIAPNIGPAPSNQAFLRTSDLNDKLKEALAILDAPATKQLSLFSVTGIDDEYEANTFIDGPYKDMVDFANVGGTPATFPTIVATSDGSQCGRPQNTPPYQELTRNDRDYLLGPLSYLLRTGIQTRAIANGLPAYGTRNTIASLNVWFVIRVLWLRLRIPLVDRDYTSPANTLPYETLPGGSINLGEQQDLVDEDNYSRNFIGFWRFANNTSLYHGPLCFVPTYSALDVASITPATAAVSYLFGAPATTSAVPRVARFIATERLGSDNYNLAHLRFTARNSEWLFNEMQGNPSANQQLNCQTECSPYPVVPIAGPDIICTNATSTTFTVNPPFGSVTGWTASPAGLVRFTSPTAGATSVTVVPASSTSTGVVTLTAQLSNGCFTGTTAPLQVGVGPPHTELVGPLTIDCGNPQQGYTITPFFRSQSYTNLTVTGPAQLKPLGYATSGSFALVIRGPGQVHVTLDVSNGCGTGTEQAMLDVTVLNNCISPKSTAALYPNPAKESVDVHVENASATQPVTVRLFDSLGQPRAEQTSTGATSVRLKTDHLPAGLYFVHILRGKEILSRQQLQIEK